jgi:endonuclease G, mitochondrial
LNKRHIALSGLVLLLLACFAAPLLAATTACISQYRDGIAPDITNAKIAVKTRELCYQSFAVMNSGITRSPLWSAEHLTREKLKSAKGLRRVNDFHAEERLPASERAELSDYARSGFDRGHMAPSADMPNAEAQWGCFTLANMIPQNPNNNRKLWEGIEAAVRTLAKREGELYVITGPLYLGSNVKRIHGRVMVPTHIYKIVFDPIQNKGAAYYVENKPGMEWRTLSISELEKTAGINFFPNLSESAKQNTLNLPTPTPHGHGRNKHREL